MNGTTLCPHCSTRFNIFEAQLTAHQGMVRCGHCMQAFDARPGFIPDQPSPQLALPIDELPEQTEIATDANLPFEPAIDSFEPGSLTETLPPAVETEPEEEIALDEPAQIAPLMQTIAPDLHADEGHFVEQLTLAEQTSSEQTSADESDAEPFVKPRIWPWSVGALIAILLLIAQSAYFFRVDLAARLPAIKPTLLTYCRMLNCSVPYPQKSALISIESSSLDADPTHENQITLNALLRNRASFNQAYPRLALTLSDNQEKPLARRLFTPAEYLPAGENETSGFRGNHEISIKLPLYTGTLRPVGYQLEFFYAPIASPAHT